ADRYPRRWQAPLRWAFRGALGARSRIVVRSSLRSRRAQAKGRR
ncbi:MAG TPA: dTDP-Rha--alpha-D-GlcNAc-pyrophosphate polyprenol alpha-3-L-rhamnosyltransferase, partial [Mycobacterium sp.]|nr:dTDP-Rha--alpha-D-GlcNAc-pyrophosphate polyprenol alpha-3-L-rhamnosyltransferase [Mycobacterium sp.]